MPKESSTATIPEKRKIGRPLKYSSPEQMQELIDAYFDKCDREGKPYTVTGLGLALNMSRADLINYEKRDEFFNTVKVAKQRVEEYLETCLHGKTVVGIIFNLKNNFGWVDKQEVDQHTTFDFGSATFTDED